MCPLSLLVPLLVMLLLLLLLLQRCTAMGRVRLSLLTPCLPAFAAGPWPVRGGGSGGPQHCPEPGPGAEEARGGGQLLLSLEEAWLEVPSKPLRNLRCAACLASASAAQLAVHLRLAPFVRGGCAGSGCGVAGGQAGARRWREVLRLEGWFGRAS